MAKIAGKTNSGKKQSKNTKSEEFLEMLKKTTPKTEKPEKKEDVIVQEKEEQIENIEETEKAITIEDYEELFGTGFSEVEYKKMYKRYELLQNNYPLRTEMHKEALATYTKYAFKRDQAIADDDVEAADKWGKLASKQATDAKINPSQLSAADLSDGMTCFSQVSATVEKAQDIIPLLNKFIEQPQDRVDYTIWQYVNYCRHLEGKPLIQYKDLYNFLKSRFEEYKMDYTFLFDEGDGKFDTNDLGD